jgi:G3E family GTPase
MKLIIFSGFLGSGKTSAILKIASTIAADNSGNKIVIIENEIGETGIDQKLLSAGGLSVRKLFAGCICCQLTSDLISTLNEIKSNLDPGLVILEATGLAYPGKIIEAVKKYAKDIECIKTITLVDAERWDELNEVTPVLITNQIKDADIILINKTDIASGGILSRIDPDIRSINPAAAIHRVNANQDNSIWKNIIQ